MVSPPSGGSLRLVPDVDPVIVTPPPGAFTAALLAHVRSRDLALELVEPHDVQLLRLYRRTGGDWDEPPPLYRTMRYDPPAGRQDRFAMLYTGTNLLMIAMECRVIAVDAARDVYSWHEQKAREYRLVRYTFEHAAVFLPMDLNAARLGLEGPHFPLGTYRPYQEVALALYERFHTVVHGLSWPSYHRGQPGRAYGLWHEHKATIGLARPDPVTHGRLIEAPEFQALLAANPTMQCIAAAPPAA